MDRSVQTFRLLVTVRMVCRSFAAPTSAMGEARFRDDEFVYVPDEVADRLQRSTCGALDIIFTKKGTLGQTGIIPPHTNYKRYLLSGNQLKLTVDRAKADPLFVYYSVSSPASRTKLIGTRRLPAFRKLTSGT